VGRAFALVEEYDAYFGVCPRIRPDGSKASVTRAPGLWADLDFKRFADAEAGALRALAAFPVPVTWVIATGGGFHVYWKLRTPARADRNLEGRLKGIAKTLNADPAATDTARVLRVPGSWHLRRDYQVRIVTWPLS
jgi:putative DNA primase/helicase